MTALASLVTFAYLAVLGLLSLFGLHRLLVLFLYHRSRSRQPVPGPLPEDALLPQLTVQLPVFNEAAVVERLVDAACRLDWPKNRLQVQVLDDSTDETTQLARRAAARFAEQGIDIEVLRRVDRRGFKAGALAEGTKKAKGDYIAIFDADFVPGPSFLKEALPHFAPGVGMVQARWGHLNEEENLLTRLSAVLLDGHFVLEHAARNRSGRFFNFNGTAGIWRKDCIEQAGGWQHDTLTEDLDLSYRAQLRGWRFVYLQDLVVPAELPASMRAFKTQQKRWAQGTMQVARKLLPRILKAPLPLPVKAEALAHLGANLSWPLVLLLAVLMPASVALRGEQSIHGLLLLDLPAFLLATCSVGLFYQQAEKEAWGSAWSRLWRIPLVMALGIGMSVSQGRAVLAGMWGRDVVFVRTPKAGSARRPRYSSRPGWTPLVELGLALYFGLAIIETGRQGGWGSLPFLCLFGLGFGYVGLSSLFDRPPAGAAAPVEPALSRIAGTH